jgi:pimeloyl-ACP methyl ester carboxylesterase
MLWEYQIPAFTAAGYRFIAVNYRGVGSNAPGPAGRNTNGLINDLVAKLGLPKFHLVGTAAGGGQALQYALSNHDKLRSITVANSIGNVQDKEYMEIGNRIRPVQFNQLPLDMRELGPSYRAVNAEGVKRWLALSNEERELGGPGGPGGPPAPGPMAGPPLDPNNPSAVTWAKLEKLTVPTLLLTGDADLYTPPSVLRMFSDRMKQAEYHIVPESGHSAYWENPDDFNGTVLAFIAKH